MIPPHICSMCIKTNQVCKQEVVIWWVQKRFSRYAQYMKLVTKYQIPVINSCWEKWDEKCTYMLNVYKRQLSRQTGSRNLTGQKTLPTKWGTYMKLVTKYQISAINICWEKWAYMGPKNASHNMAYLHNFGRGPPKNHFSKVWLRLAL